MMAPLACIIACLLAASPLPGPAVDPVSHALYQALRKGLGPARVGEWVTYELRGGPDRGGFWRLAVVAEQKDAKGRDAYWVELELGEAANMVAPLVQMKMLVARAGGLSKPDNVTRLILAVGLTEPQEVEASALGAFFRPAPAQAPVEPLPALRELHSRTGKAIRLMTAAGTVSALPVETLYRETVYERIWFSEEIPLLRIARIEIPAVAHTMEVRDFGLNARARMRPPRPTAPRISIEPGSAAPVVDSTLRTP